MKKNTYLKRRTKGLSLAEILVALVIASMIMVSVLMLYNRALRSARAVTAKIENSKIPEEILQGIAEDLESIIPNPETRITINNKFIDGYPTAKLEILKTFYNEKRQKQTYQKIVWVTAYDYETDKPGLILYRSHSGIAGEDKILDKSKAAWEQQLYIPFCNGLTFFKIEVQTDGKLVDEWTKEQLPDSVRVTLSFAEPYETLEGTWNVPDAKKVKRTIALDRTRKIAFQYVNPTLPEDFNDLKDFNDVNEFDNVNDYNDVNDFGNTLSPRY